MLTHGFVLSELRGTNSSWGAEPRNPQAGMGLIPEEGNKREEGTPAQIPAQIPAQTPASPGAALHMSCQ